ncbi:hypothetical protein CCO03_12335 [Comamonas serinivorans]|uniref:Cell envelope biogenesis protein TolA n=1 Tax=Comamonas serinivorans TaxID=1082851 RepID=A0A1Y0EPZ8_9BURK|nr:hypothetical protein CCO03_12335 [Comamonas serinivorans]
MFMGLSASAFALTAAEMKAERTRIESTYKSAMESCKPMKDNAQDICEQQAKGNKKVAEAELRLKDKPSEKARYDARMAKADADYDVAKERCDDLSGEAKDACVKDAKAVHDKEKANAEMK